MSVFKERRDEQKQTKRYNLRGMTICRVTPTAGAGRIKKTGSSFHYTQWPYADCDISSLTA